MDKPTTNDCPAWIVSCYIMTRAREVVKTNFKIIISYNGKLRLLHRKKYGTHSVIDMLKVI